VKAFFAQYGSQRGEFAFSRTSVGRFLSARGPFLHTIAPGGVAEGGIIAPGRYTNCHARDLTIGAAVAGALPKQRGETTTT